MTRAAQLLLWALLILYSSLAFSQHLGNEPGASRKLDRALRSESDRDTLGRGVREFLKPDGRIDLEAIRRSGYQGPLDLQGFSTVIDTLTQQPLLRPTSPTDHPDDIYWDNSVSQAVPGVCSQFGDAIVHALAIYDGRLVVAGRFQIAGNVLANNIASWDGTNWSTLGVGTDGAVRTLAVFQGKLFAGGYFDYAGGIRVDGVASWDGSWSALGTGINGYCYCLHVHAPNLLLVGGWFSRAGSITANNIATWNGSTWGTFGVGTNASVYTIASLAGYPVIGGDFTTAGGISARRIAGFDGFEWRPYGTGMNGAVHALAVFGGRLVVGGDFTEAGGNNLIQRVAQWNGGSWESIGFFGANSTVLTISSDSAGMTIGGYFTTVGGLKCNGVARWNGSSWAPLSWGVDGGVYAICDFQEASIAGGTFLSAGDVGVARLAAWQNGQWSRLEVPNGGFNAPIYAMTIFNNNLVVAGSFTTAGSITANRIATWDGNVWRSLGLGMNGPINAVTVFQDTLIAGGDFTVAGEDSVNFVARWNGHSWSGLGSGVDNSVFALKTYNGKLIAAGAFESAGGRSANYIASWDGYDWDSLGAGTSFEVFSLEEFSNSLFVGGDFSSAGGLTCRGLAVWNGTEWSTIGNGVDGAVLALKQAESRLFVGGDTYEASDRADDWIQLASWNGLVWSALGIDDYGSISTLEPFAERLFLGGNFTSSWGNYCYNIASWRDNESSALGSGTNRSTSALQEFDNELYVGGSFTQAGGKVAPYLAIWKKNSLRINPTEIQLGVVSGEADTANLLITGTNDESWNLTNYCSWATPNVSAGNFPDTVQVALRSDHLEQGVYHSLIEVSSAHTYNPTAKVQMTLHVDPSVDVDDEVTPIGGSGSFDIRISHDSLAGFFIPLTYAEAESLLAPRFSSGIKVDSVRISPFYLDYGTTVEIDSLNKQMRFVNHPTQDPPIPKPDTADVMVLAKVFYTVNPLAGAQVVVIDTISTSCPPFDTSGTCSIKYYLPDGTITVPNFDPGYILIGDAVNPAQQPNVLRASPGHLKVRFNHCPAETTLSVVLLALGNQELSYSASSTNSLVQLNPASGSSPVNLQIQIQAPACDTQGTIRDTIVVLSESALGPIRIPIEISLAPDCGDFDTSGRVDIGDAVYLINYIFAGGPAPQDVSAGDINLNGRTDIGDAVYLINYIFAGGPTPCEP